jgi:hypothetical protein
VGIYTVGKVYTLLLYAGPNQTGARLAHVKVNSINEEGLLPSGLPLKANDFTVSSDGKGGTLVTYVPRGTTQLDQSMPVPVIAFRSTKVSLHTIFSQSFGTSTPGFYNITLLHKGVPTNTKKDFHYWGHAPQRLTGPPLCGL